MAALESLRRGSLACLASGGYGVAEAARNGMYASATIGAILLAAGAYRLLSGNRSVGGVKSVGQGSRVLSTEEQLNFARQHFGLRFGGNFRVYDVPIIPGYGDPDSAALAALRAINPKSVRENREYGGWVYQEADGFFNHTPPVAGEGARVDITSALDAIPRGARITGTYHTHGDYSRVVGGQLIRTSDPFLDDTMACCFSPQDIASTRSLAFLHPLFRSYLANPSGTIRAYDPRLEWYPLLLEGR